MSSCEGARSIAVIRHGSRRGQADVQQMRGARTPAATPATPILLPVRFTCFAVISRKFESIISVEHLPVLSICNWPRPANRNRSSRRGDHHARKRLL